MMGADGERVLVSIGANGGRVLVSRVLVSRLSESGVEGSRISERSGGFDSEWEWSGVNILSERNILFLIKNNLNLTYEICS